MASHIGRRKFLATLGAAAAWPLAAWAQQVGKRYTVGLFNAGMRPTAPWWGAFFDALLGVGTG
jgi:putative tryptophan/tyrosine transport system substrate-binding protein